MTGYGSPADSAGLLPIGLLSCPISFLTPFCYILMAH